MTKYGYVEDDYFISWSNKGLWEHERLGYHYLEPIAYDFIPDEMKAELVIKGFQTTRYLWYRIKGNEKGEKYALMTVGGLHHWLKVKLMTGKINHGAKIQYRDDEFQTREFHEPDIMECHDGSIYLMI